METRSLDLPADLLHIVGQLNAGDLELFREDQVSLGRAAELCRTPIEAFMEYAAERDAPLHYGLTELEEDRRTLVKLRS